MSTCRSKYRGLIGRVRQATTTQATEHWLPTSVVYLGRDERRRQLTVVTNYTNNDTNNTFI